MECKRKLILKMNFKGILQLIFNISFLLYSIECFTKLKLFTNNITTAAEMSFPRGRKNIRFLIERLRKSILIKGRDLFRKIENKYRNFLADGIKVENEICKTLDRRNEQNFKITKPLNVLFSAGAAQIFCILRQILIEKFLMLFIIDLMQVS